MALEWLVIGSMAGAEAFMLLLVTLPGLNGLHQIITSTIRNALKPMLVVIPLCLFLLMDIYWKLEKMPTCEHESQACTAAENLRYQKSVAKSERNTLLSGAALLFYWLLFCVTSLVGRIDQLNQQVNKVDHKD